MKKVIVATCLCSIAGALLLYYRSNEVTEHPAPPSAELLVAKSVLPNITRPLPQPSVSPLTAKISRPPPPSPSAKLSAEFSAAKDWRVFALAARSRPEEGGYFYAMHVTNICAMGIAAMPALAAEAVAHVVAKSSTINTKQIELTDRLSNLCSSFATDEASSLRSSTKAAAADQRDPLVNALRDLSKELKTSDTGRMRQALQTLLDLKDPLAAHSDMLLTRIMSKSAQGKSPSDVWFDGKLYTRENADAYSSLQLALILSSCVDEAPCESDISMMMECLGGQFCATSRDEYFRRQFVQKGAMTDEQFLLAVKLGGRVNEVLLNREVDALMPN